MENNKKYRKMGKNKPEQNSYRDSEDFDDELEPRISYPYLGDDRCSQFIVYENKVYMYCVYCGAYCGNLGPMSREHIPSRVFLKKPYPPDLPTIPSCQNCNNGFSSDEVYSAVLIRLMRESFQHINLDNRDFDRLRRKEGKEAREFFDANKDKLGYIDNARLERILIKLAKGHAVYDLSEGYHDSYVEYKADLIYDFKPFMTEKDIDDFDYAEPMNDKILPEVGSRIYNKIGVVSLGMNPFGHNVDKNHKSIHVALLMWTDVQEGEYSYICFLEDNNIVVKMIIGDFVYAKVLFRPE